MLSLRALDAPGRSGKAIAVRGFLRRDENLDVEFTAVAIDCRDLDRAVQHRARSARHVALKTGLVHRTKPLGNDQLRQLAADRLGARPAKNRLRSRCPLD